jgi:YrbI family 3-deoxy-D-manno-octulosonate 8-phosphate phosphatase
MKKKSHLTERLKKVKLLVMDVDGTLTDSSMYYSRNGEELKRFSTRDGMGITLLHKSGILTAIVTSEDSQIVTARANKLKIEYVQLACRDKSSAVKELTKKLNLDLTEVAYIGDDINDEHVMKIVGVSSCPNDSVKIIKKIANYKCKKSGGFGAVREFAELILSAQNKPICIKEQW